MNKFLICVAVILFSFSFANAQEYSSEPTSVSIREVRKAKRTELRRKQRKTKLSDVCRNVSNLNGLLVKTTAGGHIPSSDPRYSGFSIICAGKCVPFPAKVYHCDGSTAYTMGYYGRWEGNGKSRGYCGHRAPQCPTGSVRSKNRSLKCKGAVYLSTGGKSCMKFDVNSNRNGGV